VNFSVSEQRLLEVQRRFKDKSEAAQVLSHRLKLIDDSEYPYTGKLDFVGAAVDETTGTLPVRISVPNPDRFLRPGQFVRVVVPAFESPNAIRVPERAVQELQGLKSVYVVGADNKPVSRQITAQYRVGNDWVVEQGLAPGEVVIVEGTQKVKPGMPVKPVPFTEGASEPPGTSGSSPAAGPSPAPSSPDKPFPATAKTGG
jgi:membrane fusion protein (multidrug efflux system)